MNKRHTLELKICLDDFRGRFNGDEAGRRAIETVFDLIEKVKAAVFAKSGKVRAFTFSNTPDREINIDGQIATLTFDVVTPYECHASLQFDFYATGGKTLDNRVEAYPLIDFIVCFETGPKGATGAMGPGPCPVGAPGPIEHIFCFRCQKPHAFKQILCDDGLVYNSKVPYNMEPNL